MATINVKDSSGNVVAIEKPNGNGRAAASLSKPVALATEDPTLIGEAVAEALAGVTGAPVDVPAANTVLARLKAIADGITAMSGYVDGLEALATTLNGLVDGLEGLVGTTNTSLAGISGYVDGLETLLATLNGYVDGLEGLQTTANATLAAISGYVDSVETLLTSLNGYVDGLEGALAGVATETTLAAASTKLNTIGTRAYGTALPRLAYSGTSAQSAAITGTEVLLHNCGTARCFVAIGANPTATVNDIPLEPGEKFHPRITSGHKVAAIQDSASGNLNIVPVA